MILILQEERDFEVALEEIEQGEKRTHWIWYTVPTFLSISTSYRGKKFAIKSLEEAKAYLENDLLKQRLLKILMATLKHEEKSAIDIYGTTDAKKLNACVTLFSLVSDEVVFRDILKKFFENKLCTKTLKAVELRKIRILVDMDGVLCDLEKAFFLRYKQKFPERKVLDMKKRKYHYLDYEDCYSREDVYSILSEPGFYANLPMIEGAKEAMLEMCELGYDVCICTSPFSSCGPIVQQQCEEEKRNWLKENLPFLFEFETMSTKVFVEKNKEKTPGAILIDDRIDPARGKEGAASWEHVLFHQPYNKKVSKKVSRLKNWQEWKKVILPIIEQQLK